jgi:Family of unknown function (DUF5946)
VSAKSLAAHLTGLAWALEHGGSDTGLRALQRWLNGRVDITKPPMPQARGEMTIGDVHIVAGRDAYLAEVDRWARSTWAAYSSLHAIAEQLDQPGRRSGVTRVVRLGRDDHGVGALP